jgi:hypothetical protein
MKKLNVLGLAGAAVLFCAPVCDAHVLVYRARLVGKFTYEDSLGKIKSESRLSTESGLWFLDLDTDTWISSSSQDTSRNQIQLDERPKTSKAPASKTFSYSPDGGEGVGEHRVVQKFEFYSNSRKFYYFYFQTEDHGDSGYDTGSILGQGGCRLNVNIGGARTSPVPNDFMAALTRGDGRKLGKGVLSMKYDPEITVAVNNYLMGKGILSSKGSGVSRSIPEATSWLISNYLPSKGYVNTQ